MSELQKRNQPSGLEINSLVADLEMAETAADVKIIVARAQALHDVARRAQLADDQLQKFAAISLRAMRRGGEILNTTPRAVGRSSAELPSLSTLLELPPSKAKHVAEHWLTVAAVPEPLFEEYLELPEIPTRAGLLRYKAPAIKRPAHRPRRDGSPSPEPKPPPPTRLKLVPQKEDPEPTGTHPALLHAKAEAWNQCVAWFASNAEPRVSDLVLQEAEDANPYDHAITREGHRD